MGYTAREPFARVANPLFLFFLFFFFFLGGGDGDSVARTAKDHF